MRHRAYRVTFVLPSLHGGGAERAAVLLLNGLAARGHDATLFLFRREGAYFDHLSAGTRLIEGRSGRVARVTALRTFLKRDPQDVVVSFLSHFSTYAAVRAAGTHAKYVVSQQTPLSAFLEDRDYHWRRPLQRRVFAGVTRVIYPRADAIAATSRGVADDLTHTYGVPSSRVSVVPNPVDLEVVARSAGDAVDAEFENASDVPTIVSAGRLADAKNLPLMVDALECLWKRMRFRAWILGSGELEADLRARLARSPIQEAVSLLGFQRNPWKFMARADVFLLTSRYEGFGNVLIEAMATGLPAVATASYGTRDIVEHERSGVLVERHTAEDVAAALWRVLSDAGRRRQMAAQARVRAQQFAAPRVVEQFDALLARISAWPA